MKLKNESAANAKKMNVYFKGTEEIKDEMARMKPCLDEGWRKITEQYDADEFEEQEFNYNYHDGYCDPLISNTLRMQRRYDHLKDCLERGLSAKTIEYV